MVMALVFVKKEKLDTTDMFFFYILGKEILVYPSWRTLQVIVKKKVTEDDLYYLTGNC